MKVSYTSRPEGFTETQEQKIGVKLSKCHKILGKRHSLTAHVKFSRQRHLFDAEITLRALNHTFVVSSSNTDAFLAVQSAADKLERQAARNKHKLIDVRRHSNPRIAPPGLAAEPPAIEPRAGAPAKVKLIRNNDVAPKPMTVEEAMIQIEELDRDQLTYRDAESGGLRVLLRRRDGKLELVETD
ncbi:MAG TPA: HPF/RaiA family ribosome-associated protein [Bryobacterales bacterium]|nr:HPF/RaiA family ribosome-associated protein [Bryobacterales bacterium]